MVSSTYSPLGEDPVSFAHHSVPSRGGCPYDSWRVRVLVIKPMLTYRSPGKRRIAETDANTHSATQTQVRNVSYKG